MRNLLSLNECSSSDFSVLLAVYKRDDPVLFRKSLSSIFVNSYSPLELVVVADGELTAELINIISEFSRYNPLRLIQLPVNVGLAKALNVGLSSINTKFTLRADADDINHLKRFEILVSKLNEGFDLVGSSIREVDKDGVEVAFRKCPLTQDGIIRFAKKRNPFNHMSVGFRTDSVIKAGGYPSIYLKEDYALWAVMLASGCSVCNLDEVLVDATAGKDMFRRRGGVRYAMAEINLQIHLMRCGLKSPFGALIDGVMRAIIFLAPRYVREFFYLKFLRVYKD
jgi:glycosyltransferase involved in cell wall biosynthesis